MSFSCGLCNQTFSTRRSLLRHQTCGTHLTQQNTAALLTKFPCPRCPQSFTRQHDVRRHLRSKHRTSRRPSTLVDSSIPNPGGVQFITTENRVQGPEGSQVHQERRVCEGNEPNNSTEMRSVGQLALATDESNQLCYTPENSLYPSQPSYTSHGKDTDDTGSWQNGPNSDIEQEQLLRYMAEWVQPHTAGYMTQITELQHIPESAHPTLQVQDLQYPHSSSSGVASDAWLETGLKDLSLSDRLVAMANVTGNRHGGTPRSTLQRCPVCYRAHASPHELRVCMEGHLDNLIAEHVCEQCDFNFVRNAHLQRHLQSVSIHGHCGLKFAHSCSGHHAPVESLDPVGFEKRKGMHHWYLTQLCLVVDKKMHKLAQRPSGQPKRRWSATELKRPDSPDGSVSTLNTVWSAPTVVRSVKEGQNNRAGENRRFIRTSLVSKCNSFKPKIDLDGYEGGMRWLTDV